MVMGTTMKRLKRWLCRHHFVKCGKSWFGNVFRCTKCNGVFYEYGSLKKHYMAQYDEVFDENGEMRI